MNDMAKETVDSIANKVANGTMDAAEAGRKMRDLVTRREPARNEAERMKRYYEGHHEAAIETDPNSFLHVRALYHAGEITDAQMAAIRKAMHSDELSETLEYYLTEGDPPQPVRKIGDRAEVFSAEGWVASEGTEDLEPCTEDEALAAAKKVMGT